MSTTTPAPVHLEEPSQQPARGGVGPWFVLILLAVAATLQARVAEALDIEVLQAWSTLFVSLNVQAVPFLVLGVVVSGVLAAFLPGDLLARLLPRSAAGSVAGAAAAGVLLPGCECGSVPISGRLMARGAPAAAALAFMLAAPAINPVVLVATSVAFPDRPILVLARFVASLATAIIVGLLWLRRDSSQLLERVRATSHDHGDRFEVFVATVRHDMLHAGGYLVLGAAAAATMQVLVPVSVLDTLAGNLAVSVAVLSILAFVLSICSEADAFVAASLSQFPLTARLAFLVVGPVIDLKLLALQAGMFGRGFALRFAPLSFGVAVVVSVIVGEVLL